MVVKLVLHLALMSGLARSGSDPHFPWLPPRYTKSVFFSVYFDPKAILVCFRFTTTCATIVSYVAVRILHRFHLVPAPPLSKRSIVSILACSEGPRQLFIKYLAPLTKFESVVFRPSATASFFTHPSRVADGRAARQLKVPMWRCPWMRSPSAERPVESTFSQSHFHVPQLRGLL